MVLRRQKAVLSLGASPDSWDAFGAPTLGHIGAFVRFSQYLGAATRAYDYFRDTLAFLKFVKLPICFMQCSGFDFIDEIVHWRAIASCSHAPFKGWQ